MGVDFGWEIWGCALSGRPDRRMPSSVKMQAIPTTLRGQHGKILGLILFSVFNRFVSHEKYSSGSRAINQKHLRYATEMQMIFNFIEQTALDSILIALFLAGLP